MDAKLVGEVYAWVMKEARERSSYSGRGESRVVTGREYDITGATKYKVYIDNHDTPVMFVVDDDSGQVTFTLKK